MLQPITVIGERIRYRMLEKGLNAMELARRSNVKPSFLYDIMNGKSANPSIVKLSQVAKELEVELEYILGEGKLELTRSRPMEDEEGCHIIIKELQTLSAAETVAPFSSPYAFQKKWIRQTLRAMPENVRLTTLHGDGMEPTLYDGDIVLVDISRKHPTPPGIFMLFDGLGPVAKRLEFVTNSTPPSVHVLSDNARYSAYTRPLAELQIVGRIIWFGRKL